MTRNPAKQAVADTFIEEARKLLKSVKPFSISYGDSVIKSDTVSVVDSAKVKSVLALLDMYDAQPAFTPDRRSE